MQVPEGSSRGQEKILASGTREAQPHIQTLGTRACRSRRESERMCHCASPRQKLAFEVEDVLQHEPSPEDFGGVRDQRCGAGLGEPQGIIFII